jgi:hypothetical protein
MQLVQKHETLVAALRELGVDYLSPSDAKADQKLDDETLIASLASHSEARLRQALIALFLLQPQLARVVPRLQSEIDAHALQELIAYYSAAMYLQRMWRTRLGHYLSSVEELPDYFSGELALPSPRELYGKAGLHALADWHARQSSQRCNHLSAYEGVAELLFQSLKSRRKSHEPAQQS